MAGLIRGSPSTGRVARSSDSERWGGRGPGRRAAARKGGGEPMPSLLQDYVLEQAEERSSAVAVFMGPRVLTYGELEESSNRLARLLQDAGCRRGDRVCLFTPKGPA